MKDLIDKLQFLDIPRREGEVYLALLQKKEFSAPEIAKITSVSRTKSYEVLQNLVKKGLCNESYKNGIKVFSSIEPKIVFENIISDYEHRKILADQLQKSLTDLHKKKEASTEPLDYIEVLTDLGQIRERWLNIQKNTKKKILAFTKPPYVVTPYYNVEEEAILMKNKVAIKSVYEYGRLTNKETKNLIMEIEAYHKIGEQARVIKELPMKLVISDDTTTMLALNDRVSLKPSITTIIVDHPSFAKAHKEVFETYWAKAIPFEDFKRDPNKYK